MSVSFRCSTEEEEKNPEDFEEYLQFAFDQLIPEMNCKLEFLRQSDNTSTPLQLNKPHQRFSPMPNNRTGAAGQKELQQHLVVITKYDHDNNLSQLSFKNCIVPREILRILSMIIPFHQHISILTFDSSAVAHTIYEIHAFQPLLLYLTQINIDSCPFPEANFDILLDNPTFINHLSLTRCGINDLVVQNIFAKLTSGPAASLLSSINLASNNISDLGAVYIAQCLHTNRRLRYINLSRNELTDLGVIIILDTLKMFPMTREHCIMKRQANFEFLIKNFPLGVNFERNVKVPKNVSRRSTKTSEKDQSIGDINQADCKVFEHAFSKNNIITIDGGNFCMGNNCLCALNLSYNQLTLPSLNRFVEVIKYQVNANRKPKGLVYVNIDGNFINPCSQTIELMKLLDTQMELSINSRKVKKSSGMLKYKKSSATASITSSPNIRNMR